MTPTRFTSLALLLAALAAVAQAQTSDQPGPTNAGSANASGASATSRLNWPHTFTGQPDFEFSRADVLDERVRHAREHKEQPPTLPTLSDLLEDIPLDPLGLSQANVSGSTVSGTENLATLIQGGTAVTAAGTSSTLPVLPKPADINLAEFKASLQQAVDEYVRAWQPDFRQYDLAYLLRDLKLNGVMTSPERIAIINGQNYRVGDQLRATIYVGPSDTDILTVLQAQMPAAGTLTPDQQNDYQAAYKSVLKSIADQKQKEPQRYQRAFTLPVIVRAIQSRKVTLDFNGVTYDLSIPFLY